MTVSLLEILAAARAHAAPLAAESAGYLLLAVADHAAVAPRAVAPDEIELGADGAVRLRAPRGGGVAGESVEANVRRLLSRALQVSSSVGPGLRRAAERRDDAGLERLVRELETALIPVNRSAARRALSRLHRETERARVSGKLEAWVQAEADLDASGAPSAPSPIVVAPRAKTPVPVPVPVAAPPVVEPEVDLSLAELPEPSPLVLPTVVAAPTPAPVRVALPEPVLTLTPEPQLAVGEPALTKPEPVVVRNRERSGSTPRFGTIVTAQTLHGEDSDRTERAPDVALMEEADQAVEIDVDVDLELSPEAPVVAEDATPTPVRAVAAGSQPLVDPEPSTMPDVLLAMVALHAGIDADDAPTRLRDVVTAVAPTSLPAVVELEQVEAAEPELAVVELEQVEITPYVLFHSELADPEVHEALTWNPGPVVSLDAPLPAPLLIAEPPPELSPLAPAVLPVRQSDVSELLDSFYVSGAAEEQDLRSALKEMAGLELTPMPHRLVSER